MFRKSKFIGSLWPEPASATLAADGITLSVVMTGKITTNSGETAAQWTLDGTASTVSSVAADGSSTVVLTLDSIVDSSATLTLSYAAGANPMTSVYLTRTVYDFSAFPVTNLADNAPVVDAGDDVVDLNQSDGSYTLSGASVTDDYGDTILWTITDSPVGSAPTLDNDDTLTPTLNYDLAGDYELTLTADDGVNTPVADVVVLTVLDDVAPTIVSIVINAAGDTLTQTYSEALDETSVPDVGDGAIAGTSATIDAGGTVVVSGTTVAWPIDGPVLQGETVTFDYTAGTNKIRDAAHNNAASLVASAVTNNSTQVSAPVLVSAIIPAGGDRILWTYDQALDEGSVPDAGDYSTNSYPYNQVSSVSISGTVVTTMLEKTMGSGAASIFWSYTQGTNKIRNLAHTDADGLVSQGITNNSTQTVVSIQYIAAYEGGDHYLYLQADKNLADLVLANPTAFVLSGTSATIVSGSCGTSSFQGTRTIGFIVSAAITEFGTAKLSYTPAVDSIIDEDGRTLEAFSNLLIFDDN